MINWHQQGADELGRTMNFDSREHSVERDHFKVCIACESCKMMPIVGARFIRG